MGGRGEKREKGTEREKAGVGGGTHRRCRRRPAAPCPPRRSSTPSPLPPIPRPPARPPAVSRRAAPPPVGRVTEGPSIPFLLPRGCIPSLLPRGCKRARVGRGGGAPVGEFPLAGPAALPCERLRCGFLLASLVKTWAGFGPWESVRGGLFGSAVRGAALRRLCGGTAERRYRAGPSTRAARRLPSSSRPHLSKNNQTERT